MADRGRRVKKAEKAGDAQPEMPSATSGSPATPEPGGAPQSKAKDPLAELGGTGLEIWGGRVTEEVLPELSGTKAAKVFREMAKNDAMVGAVLFAIRMLIRQVDWTVQPASAKPQDEQAAEFIRTCMQDMSHTWDELISEALSMLIYGHSVHEIVYKRREGMDGAVPSRYDDGRIGWRRLPIRAQTTIWRWLMDDSGSEFVGIEQNAPPHYRATIIPAVRLLHFRTTGYKNNPEGESILRTAYRSWYFKSRTENLQGIGVERDLVGIPVGWVPPGIMRPGAPADQRAMFESFKQLVANIRQNEQAGVIMPLSYDDDGRKLFDLTLLSAAGSRLFDTIKILNYYDQRITMSALADFILIGHEHAGSFALNSSKTDLFATALGAFLGMIQDTLNRSAIPRLLRVNPEFRIEAPPTVEHGDVEHVDLKEFGDALANLVGAGIVTPDQGLEDHVRLVGGMPAVLESDAADVDEPDPDGDADGDGDGEEPPDGDGDAEPSDGDGPPSGPPPRGSGPKGRPSPKGPPPGGRPGGQPPARKRGLRKTKRRP